MDALIDVLRAAWKRHPEQRLCQFVVNVTNRNDPFYVEDEALGNLLLREGQA